MAGTIRTCSISTVIAFVFGATLAGADLPQLRRFENSGRIFDLRRALQPTEKDDPGTLFYRAVSDARFGQEKNAIENLRTFVATSGDPELRRKAFQEIAEAAARLGLYGEASQAWTDALRLTPANNPDRAAHANSRSLYGALADIPPQSVEIREGATIQGAHNRLGSWDVPVEVNGTEGQWIFDTGASLSTVSESEAKKMGLSPRDTTAYIPGSTGKENPLRLAVAGLRAGPITVTNVILLVLPDDALYIAPLKHQINGILGLPVIRAMGRVGVSAQGVVEIGAKTPAGQEEPNLFFDGSALIAETLHRGQRLRMFLDTGANTSLLYPSFRDAMGKDELTGLNRRQEKTAGAGGMIRRKTQFIPVLRLEVLGHNIEIKGVSLLSKQPSGGGRTRDGVLGMDALPGAFTLDFRTMQLLVE